ncbi:trypsin-like serine protease [Actinoplanes auranticolor]|uniref:trypsin-like serine protease n=1 Tax=Actinoplanes auranticolor TaxID=47988 RepID=UPI001BB45517|nr:trypsin-like serine protease [Actinoplanes auranticolor]
MTFPFPEHARKQIPLVQAASAVRKEIERRGPAGYAGIELEDEHVTVWWKGKLPAEMERTIAAARKIAPVHVGTAKHSLRELRTAGAELRSAYAAAKPRIKYAVDGSRIVVATSGRSGITRQLPNVGVAVEIVDQGTKLLTSRRDDWAPWKSGADQINGNSRCTTGFPVRNGNNERFILTAGHCGSNGNQIRDGVGEFMGTFTADNDGHDIALISTPGNVDNVMYVGGLDSNVVTTVVGWDWTFPGEYLCQSGGSSARDTGGPVCGLRVEKFNTDSGDAVEARQVDGRPAVRGGDSGGPVYGPAANGGVVAKGINNYTYVGNNTILGFQDFGTATRDYGIWIVE